MTDEPQNFMQDYSRFLDSTGKHLTYSALSVYRNSDSELSAKERLFLKSHLTSCPDCSARMHEVEEIEGEGDVRPQKKIFSLTPDSTRYAAAALVIISFGIFAAYQIMEHSSENGVSQTLSSEPTLTAAQPDPAKFVPDQILENLIERNVRSGENVLFLSPNNGDTLTIPFTFSWKNQKGSENYTVTVVDNKNDQIWKKTISSSKIRFDKTLPPGLYYVKLEADEKLKNVERFIIVR